MQHDCKPLEWLQVAGGMLWIIQLCFGLLDLHQCFRVGFESGVSLSARGKQSWRLWDTCAVVPSVAS